MNDLAKTFPFDLQRFAQVAYPNIRSDISDFNISGESTTVTSASSINGDYFWNAEEGALVEGTFGNSSAVYLDVDAETNNFSVSGLSGTYSYFSVSSVNAIDFTAEDGISSNYATFTNFPTTGSVKITSETFLDYLKFNDTDKDIGSFNFTDGSTSGASFALNDFTVTDGVLKIVNLDNGSLSTSTDLADGINVNINNGSLIVNGTIGESAILNVGGNIQATKFRQTVI